MADSQIVYTEALALAGWLGGSEFGGVGGPFRPWDSPFRTVQFHTCRCSPKPGVESPRGLSVMRPLLEKNKHHEVRHSRWVRRGVPFLYIYIYIYIYI